MNHADFLRHLAVDLGQNAGDDETILNEIADHIEQLEAAVDLARKEELLTRIRRLEAERDAAVRLLGKLGYNANEYLPPEDGVW